MIWLGTISGDPSDGGSMEDLLREELVYQLRSASEKNARVVSDRGEISAGVEFL